MMLGCADFFTKSFVCNIFADGAVFGLVAHCLAVRAPEVDNLQVALFPFFLRENLLEVCLGLFYATAVR